VLLKPTGLSLVWVRPRQQLHTRTLASAAIEPVWRVGDADSSTGPRQIFPPTTGQVLMHSTAPVQALRAPSHPPAADGDHQLGVPHERKVSDRDEADAGGRLPVRVDDLKSFETQNLCDKLLYESSHQSPRGVFCDSPTGDLRTSAGQVRGLFLVSADRQKRSLPFGGARTRNRLLLLRSAVGQRISSAPAFAEERKE